MYRTGYNTNHETSFTLTPTGKDYLDKHIDNVRNMSIHLKDYNIKPGEDGKYSLQLWSAFRIFGPACRIGPESPFDNCTIELNSKYLEHPKEIINIVSDLMASKQHHDWCGYPNYVDIKALETLCDYFNIDYNSVT